VLHCSSYTVVQDDPPKLEVPNPEEELSKPEEDPNPEVELSKPEEDPNSESKPDEKEEDDPKESPKELLLPKSLNPPPPPNPPYVLISAFLLPIFDAKFFIIFKILLGEMIGVPVADMVVIATSRKI